MMPLFPANIRLDEDAFKTSFLFVFRRPLQDVLIKMNIVALLIRLQKTSSKRLDQDQDFPFRHLSSRCFQDVLKTSSKHLQDIFKTFWRNLQDVFKTSCQDIFKTSSKRLQDVLQKRLQDIFKTSSKDVFKTFSRCIIRLKCLPRSRICLGNTFEKFMISVENLQAW